MPASITHYIHAEKVLHKLFPNTIINPECQNAFYWGAQGPDFFYFHRKLPWLRGENIRKYGEMFHNEDFNKIIKSAKTFLKNNDEEVYLYYILGLCCHFSLDYTAHPYINFLAADLLKEKPQETFDTLHNEIESAIDTIIIRSEKETLVTSVNLKNYFPNSEYVQNAIGTLYQYLIKDLFDEDIEEEFIVECTEDAQKVCAVLNDKHSVKKNIVEFFEKGKAHTISCHMRPLLEDADIDYANIEKNTWIDENGNQSNEDIFQLVEKGVGNTLKVIKILKS